MSLDRQNMTKSSLGKLATKLYIEYVKEGRNSTPGTVIENWQNTRSEKQQLLQYEEKVKNDIWNTRQKDQLKEELPD